MADERFDHLAIHAAVEMRRAKRPETVADGAVLDGVQRPLQRQIPGVDRVLALQDDAGLR